MSIDENLIYKLDFENILFFSRAIFMLHAINFINLFGILGKSERIFFLLPNKITNRNLCKQKLNNLFR